MTIEESAMTVDGEGVLLEESGSTPSGPLVDFVGAQRGRHPSLQDQARSACGAHGQAHLQAFDRRAFGVGELLLGLALLCGPEVSTLVRGCSYDRRAMMRLLVKCSFDRVIIVLNSEVGEKILVVKRLFDLKMHMPYAVNNLQSLSGESEADCFDSSSGESILEGICTHTAACADTSCRQFNCI